MFVETYQAATAQQPGHLGHPPLPFRPPPDQILQITKPFSKFAPPDSLDDNLSNTTSLQDCSHTPPKSMVSICSRKRECQTEALLRN